MIAKTIYMTLLIERTVAKIWTLVVCPMIAKCVWFLAWVTSDEAVVVKAWPEHQRADIVMKSRAQ
jgi:hypothetical protein